MNHPEEFKAVGIIETLRQCQLFSGFPLTGIERLAKIIQLKSLKKGDYVFHQGDPVTGFYIIRRGGINVHRVNANGKMHVIHIFRSGESFAEAALTMESGYPASASALEPTDLLFVQKEGIIELIKHDPELALCIISSMSAHLRMIVAKLEYLALEKVETRFASWLIERCPDPDSNRPCEIVLTKTKRVLASQIGTVSETLSRILAKFREQKLIAVDGKIITVLSPAKLKKLLS